MSHLIIAVCYLILWQLSISRCTGPSIIHLVMHSGAIQTMGRVPAGASRVFRIAFRTLVKLKSWYHIGSSTPTCESAKYSTLHTRSFGRLAMAASRSFGAICGNWGTIFWPFHWKILPDFQPWQICRDAHIPTPTELQLCGGAPQ